MKLSWNNLKISIAGARLSHLVQRDKIWDHGSMIEQVRTVFVYLKKAFLKNDLSIAKKCITSKCFERLSKDLEAANKGIVINADLISVEIISVFPAKNNHLNKFRTLIKLSKRRAEVEGMPDVISLYRNFIVEQEWLFVHEGNWWLLDCITQKKSKARSKQGTV